MYASLRERNQSVKSRDTFVQTCSTSGYYHLSTPEYIYGGNDGKSPELCRQYMGLLIDNSIAGLASYDNAPYHLAMWPHYYPIYATTLTQAIEDARAIFNMSLVQESN